MQSTIITTQLRPELRCLGSCRLHTSCTLEASVQQASMITASPLAAFAQHVATATGFTCGQQHATTH